MSCSSWLRYSWCSGHLADDFWLHDVARREAAAAVATREAAWGDRPNERAADAAREAAWEADMYVADCCGLFAKLVLNWTKSWAIRVITDLRPLEAAVLARLALAALESLVEVATEVEARGVWPRLDKTDAAACWQLFLLATGLTGFGVDVALKEREVARDNWRLDDKAAEEARLTGVWAVDEARLPIAVEPEAENELLRVKFFGDLSLEARDDLDEEVEEWEDDDDEEEDEDDLEERLEAADPVCTAADAAAADTEAEATETDDEGTGVETEAEDAAGTETETETTAGCDDEATETELEADELILFK